LELTEGVSLIIAGSGDILPVLKKRVRELNLSDRVRFVEKMPWNELLRYTRSA
jgi:glycosyltransferase involved in cell wall biosynthesis